MDKNGFDLTTLSAAKLTRVFNAVTTGKPVAKFESTPRALGRTLAELDKVRVSRPKRLIAPACCRARPPSCRRQSARPARSRR